MKVFIEKLIICLAVSIVVFIIYLKVSILMNNNANRDCYYIAHGGGAIDGYAITNTLEAVENAIAHNIKYIELDILETSDGKLVAAHDWETFSYLTGVNASYTNPPSYDTVKNSKVCGKYTPMTVELIDSVFRANPDLHLVTDKIRDMAKIDDNFRDFKDRMLVECFTRKQYSDCLALGYTPMYSFESLSPTGLNVVWLYGKRFFLRHFLPREFAVFSNLRISTSQADSIFAAEPSVRYIYVDYI